MIENCGAYGYAMSSNYNLRERPAEVLVRNENEVCLIRKRETLESILSNIVLIWVCISHNKIFIYLNSLSWSILQ